MQVIGVVSWPIRNVIDDVTGVEPPRVVLPIAADQLPAHGAQTPTMLADPPDWPTASVTAALRRAVTSEGNPPAC